MTLSQLDQLRNLSIVVADSSDFEQIKAFHPVDATTNPSLVFAAAQKPQYHALIESAIENAKKETSPEAKRSLLIDSLFVNFGIELLKIVPGRVSTEVEAALSFDTDASIKRARHIISLYEQQGFKRERVLIKLAATWEGIKAAEVLEKEGIHCNMTLIFSLVQAVACAEVKATLISPFVGRVLDWYKKENPTVTYSGNSDPGVTLVRQVYTYFKKMGYKTTIMAASFRNAVEPLSLAGCDLLTISPRLLEELSSKYESITQKLSPQMAESTSLEKLIISENTFRFMLNENAMATEKLSEGIRLFTQDTKKLVDMINHLISSTEN